MLLFWMPSSEDEKEQGAEASMRRREHDLAGSKKSAFNETSQTQQPVVASTCSRSGPPPSLKRSVWRIDSHRRISSLLLLFTCHTHDRARGY